MSRLLRLYPRWWRERYGDEADALLAERGLSSATRSISSGAPSTHGCICGNIQKSRCQLGVPLSGAVGYSWLLPAPLSL